MNNRIYNIVIKKYNKFIKPNNNNTELGTYYNLYDDRLNFLERFSKADLQKILNKHNIKYNNLKFQH